MAQDQAPTVPNEEVSPGNTVEGLGLPVRRSGRVCKRPHSYDTNSPQKNPSAAPQPAPETRRNPKRKAAPESFDVPDNLLEASLGPWKEHEQSEWPSWVELESDPAFFTAILGQLGVKGARIEEVLSVDEDSLAMLPHPVYGLVFLYSYVEEEYAEPEKTEHDVWFANQTTHNACATIALLNIVMNAENLALGEKLRKFKQDSMDLSPPLRGNMISNSEWIRTAHNSFARRLDLLNSALALQNQVDKRRKRAKSSNSKAKKTTKRKSRSSGGQSDEEPAYHFIAFVPVGNKVWQLDGLQGVPACIGEYQPHDHWTSVMRPVLQERMMRYETDQLSFSLLALCNDRLAEIRQQLATNIQILSDFATKHHYTAQDPIHASTDPRLFTYHLTTSDIQSISPDDLKAYAPSLYPSPHPSPSRPPTEGPHETAAHTTRVWENLAAEQSRLRTEYASEQRMGYGGGSQEPLKLVGRTKDYSAAIHEWVKRLAEHGVLRELGEEARLFTGA
ncbi:hypothetical protein N0V88_006142 [Collariella sp. IMI 366227]|nr:hypothetical protein N0V88_006142 [Collariella sp. IMI 366227]